MNSLEIIIQFGLLAVTILINMLATFLLWLKSAGELYYFVIDQIANND
jgi:hypothetical protein